MENYLVIGGSSGIGKAIVNLLANEGHKVYATYNATEMEDSEQVSYHKLDVLADELDLDFLPEEINGIAYCPGSINLKPFNRFKEKDFLEDYKLQVLGATKIIQEILPKLKAVEKSSIVFFSTVAVQQGFNFHSQVAMSKGALEGLTKALSAEFAPNIRVNAIAPALTQTPLAERLLNSEQKIKANSEMSPLKALGQPEDIAEAAVYLLTPKSKWVTGQIFKIDGGMSTVKL
ncbi:SDR family NAD(P)-dependent oxidoreductase [Galbibacter mesophilus]|uniref:SDR family NAD(P)-dependent oxidoreductase n=1 Tax=Galbibacter mesophilus TaxID=379069 RepID=UPI00192000ED|nr:SDR family oxidoreductase [Galbibacter mesophilus]MCM5662985.1 SDR family oxidoreductase [Galbibacter mesophilus]